MDNIKKSDLFMETRSLRRISTRRTIRGELIFWILIG